MMQLFCKHKTAIFAFLCGLQMTFFGPAHATPLVLLDSSLSSSLMVLISTGDLCVTYSYDANGNRIAQSSHVFGTPGAVWGSGVYGCFNWTP